MTLIHRLVKSIGLAASLGFLAFGLAKGEEIAVGAEAPKLVCQDQDGKEVKLEEIYKTGMTLVYFYPKASTPG